MLIVEGMDNSGKSTLTQKLSQDLDLAVLHSPSEYRYNFDKMMDWMENEMENQRPVIYDRISPISDSVYGPIIRGGTPYNNTVQGQKIFQKLKQMKHFIIYCRPPAEKILGFGDGREQMVGVHENGRTLLAAYDNKIGNMVDTGWRIFIYDYTDPTAYKTLLKEVKAFLKELKKATEKDKLVRIFNQQASMMEKYEKIEESNGLLETPDVPVDLNCYFGQARLRNFGWRITEELGEFLDAYNSKHIDDAMEELSDVLHFLTEFTILAGYTPEDLTGLYGYSESNCSLEKLYENSYNPGTADEDNLAPYTRVGLVIENLAMTINCLKNKAWKHSPRETDRDKFIINLGSTWENFITLTKLFDIDAQEMYDLYFGKAKINEKRQETGY